jgi:environmental stress-induced protein Ves
VPAALKIIRKSSFVERPWKNAGGTTQEAIRVPPGDEAFLWRVSVAHIEASGPFSDFAGFNRKMVLLRGSGLALTFANGERRVLKAIGDLAEFDGAVPAYCELLDGPCVDLNVMVSKALRAEVRIERVGQGRWVHASQSESILIFSIEDALTVDAGSGESRLEPGDLAVLSGGRTRVAKVGPPLGSRPSAVFFAAIYH